MTSTDIRAWSFVLIFETCFEFYKYVFPFVEQEYIEYMESWISCPPVMSQLGGGNLELVMHVLPRVCPGMIFLTGLVLSTYLPPYISQVMTLAFPYNYR